MLFVENPKKTIKNLRDIEKLMVLMQKNRISSILVDGVQLSISSFKSDTQNQGQQINGRDTTDEDLLYYSS